MNTPPLAPNAALHLQTTEESAAKADHAARDVVLAAVALVLATSACVYGFVKIVPLALAHTVR